MEEKNPPLPFIIHHSAFIISSSGVAPFAVRESTGKISNLKSQITSDSSRRPESIQTASPTRLIYPSGNAPDLSTNARLKRDLRH